MTVQVSLTGVLVCLLLVGITSDTFVRHLIQVIPILIVLVMKAGGSLVTRYAALPILIVWALIMMLIGLYLMGVVTFFTGSFSQAEVALTVLIFAFAVAGIWACFRGPVPPFRHRIVAFVAFTLVQLAAMWISFLPAFANR